MSQHGNNCIQIYSALRANSRGVSLPLPPRLLRQKEPNQSSVNQLSPRSGFAKV